MFSPHGRQLNANPLNHTFRSRVPPTALTSAPDVLYRHQGNEAGVLLGMRSYILDMTEDASEDLAQYRAFERKLITDEVRTGALGFVTSKTW